ncbi:MAG: hypothetical protein HKM98_04115 [Gammaproteobacteria bacterium]|nr:hypothetical protein [Gammaproteobacteria bacterium]
MFRSVLLVVFLAAGSLPAQAELSGNIGWQSQYIFRGIPQSTSSAQGGLDYESGGFYLGTWAADVGTGAEIDAYGGYGWTAGDFSFGIGTTAYFYTDQFDDNYLELNLNGGYGFVTIDVAVGRYDNFAGPTLDYTFASATFEHESGLYGIIGNFSQDFKGNYYAAGYGTTIEDFDVSLEWIYSDDKLLGGNKETNLVFSLSKGFDLNK